MQSVKHWSVSLAQLLVGVVMSTKVSSSCIPRVTKLKLTGKTRHDHLKKSTDLELGITTLMHIASGKHIVFFCRAHAAWYLIPRKLLPVDRASRWPLSISYHCPCAIPRTAFDDKILLLENPILHSHVAYFLPFDKTLSLAVPSSHMTTVELADSPTSFALRQMNTNPKLSCCNLCRRATSHTPTDD